MIKLAVRRNIFSLYTLQAGNYIIPLMTLPWLTRHLGVGVFGQFGFITACVAYFVLLVDWGFALSATKQIAIHNKDKLQRSNILWTTLIARSFLALLGLALMEFVLSVIPQFQGLEQLFHLAFMTVLGATVNPAFYYQGVERADKMAWFNLLVRFSSLPFTILFVSTEQDIGRAIGIQSTCVFLAALGNLILLVFSGDVVVVKPKISAVFESLKDGWPLFLSTASISLYTNSNVVILGFVSNSTAVASFTAAQTFIRAGQGMYEPISQSLFPRMSHHFLHSPDTAWTLLRQLMWLQGLVTLLGSCALFIASHWMVGLLFGPEFDSAVSILRWLSPLLFLIGLSNVFGIQGMVPLGYTIVFSRILLISGLLNIILIIPLGYWLSGDGAAIALLTTEFVVTVLMGVFMRSIEPKLFKIPF